MLRETLISSVWGFFILGLLAASVASAQIPSGRVEEPKAWPGDTPTWPAPLEEITLHVVRTGNDDGTDLSPMTLSAFSSRLPGLNQIYENLGIRFGFDPTIDFETVLDTKLNKTFELLDDPANYTDPSVRPPVEEASFKAARRAFADQYRGKLVIFLANPDRLRFVGGSWQAVADWIHSSSHNERYVSMVAYPSTSIFAHEIGHFLHVTHPFVGQGSVAQAEDRIASELAKGLPVAEGLSALDGDRSYVLDTPADAGTAIWDSYFGVNQRCAGTDSTGIPLNVSLPGGGSKQYFLQPNRRLAMTYFYCSPLEFSPQQTLRVHDALDVLNRHDLLSEEPTPETHLERRGSAYAGAIVEVEAVRVGRGRIATAVLASNSMMKVIPWDVSKSGSITRAAAGAYAGPVSEIATAGMGLGQLVTAVRNGSGNLQLITWRVHDDGTVERLSSAVDVPIKTVQIVRFDMLNVVTAVQLPNNNLKVIAWQLNADGSIVRLAEADAGEVDGFDLSASWLGVTISVRDGSGNLKVINWQVRRYAQWQITRKGSAAIAPTTATIAAIGMDIPSYGATAYTDAFDWLKVSTWAGDYDGNVTPASTEHVGAKCSEIAAARLGTELLAVGCRATGNNSLLMTLLETGPGGQGIQLLDYEFVGEVSALSFARAHQDVLVSAVRNGSGNLQLIAWKRSEGSSPF